MKRITYAFAFVGLVAVLAGCSAGVGDNPQMPPADQRIDNNHVEFKGNNPPPTGTQPTAGNSTK